MEIPQAIKDAAKELIELYGDNILYVGQYSNNDIYQFQFPEDSDTGFPFVYLLNKDETIEKITGPEALDLLQAI